MRKRYLLLISAVAMLIFSGCSSKSNFYQLYPKNGTGETSQTHRLHTKVIGIAEVDLPEYLDKPQIVTRLSSGRLNVNEEERWAGAFDRNIQSVLSKNLSAMLTQYSFLPKPWEEPIKEHYRIYLSVARFDADIKSGNVVFEGRWSLADPENNRLITGEEIHMEEQGALTLDAMVEAQSRLLERLSRHIAKKLKSFL